MSRDISPFRDEAIDVLSTELVEQLPQWARHEFDAHAVDARAAAKEWLRFSADDLVDERCAEMDGFHAEMYPEFATVGPI